MNHAYGAMGGGLWIWPVAAVVVVALLRSHDHEGIQQMIVRDANG